MSAVLKVFLCFREEYDGKFGIGIRLGRTFKYKISKTTNNKGNIL